MTASRSISLLLAAVSLAIPAGAEPPQPALSGPSVEAAAGGPTLVRTGYDGQIEPLEALPEVAALDLLGLSPETLADARRVVTERTAVFDRIVKENFALILRLGPAFASEDQTEAIGLFAEFYRALEPLQLRGTARQEISLALPERARQEFLRIVDEFRAARVASARRVAETTGEDSSTIGVALKLHFEEVGKELERSIYRQLGDGERQLQALFDAVEATDEQQGKITAMAVDFFGDSLGNPTKAQQAEFIVQVLEVLTPKQRNQLISKYRRGELP